MDEILYLKIPQNVIVYNRVIKFRDFAVFYCINKSLVKSLENEIFYTLQEQRETKYIFTINKVIEKIKSLHPKLSVVSLGESDFIIDLREKKRENKIAEYIKTAFVTIFSFFGAAFTIMTFDEDVSVGRVFDKVYLSLMGSSKQGGSILELCYSIGLPIGIIVFYNHFRHKKITEDPTPIQVEMYNYKDQVNRTIIEASSREGTTIDTD